LNTLPEGVTLVIPKESAMAGPTTLKLTDELKQRIVPLARSAGKTPHAWMVDAIERQAALAEARADFVRAAEESARDVDAGGALYAAADVVDYLIGRTEGRRTRRPVSLRKPKA
jgi:predicted transcriptional regulator